MALDTMDKVVAALAAAQFKDLYKPSAGAEGAGLFQSLWKTAGGFPPAGANPPVYGSGSGYVPTKDTLGAIPFTNPLSGNTYLLQASYFGATVGKLILYDRLWACSGIPTNGTGSVDYTIVTPGALTRGDTDGLGVEAWLEVYGAPGATAANWTLSYLDADDAPQTAVYAHPGNAETVGQMMPLPPANTRGVKSVVKLNTSTTSGTAGDIGITLLRRIAEIPFPVANAVGTLDFASLGMPQIPDNACLALMVLCTATNTGLIHGRLALAQG